ncbi:MAG: class I SAM-dependent methyltransferase [Desulfuromonadaceae bacterium]|nr:class I SAM-dependent methyltransferase [Desulfuromonadaceae bacterium]MDD2854116.1 class I SAM-dependent methyltransferase [Desulfuromonadaceae bacterium]
MAVLEPFWLDDVNSNPIAAADTGLVRRNISLASQVAGVLYLLMGERGIGRYVDVAGGHGLFTRLMRDLGFDFYWVDLYCKNILSQGFEYEQEIGACRAVTAFEVLEHLQNPAEFIQDALSMSGAHTILFSTELYDGIPPQPDDWPYYAFANGQHIAFYQRRTLERLAANLGLYFVSANGLHIFSKKRINEQLLGLVTSILSPCVALWIRFHLGSKTVSDHKLIIDRTHYISRQTDS